MPRKRHFWKLKERQIQLGERTLVMGVLNVTPDSFSDGGKYLDPDRAFARALEIEDEGADLIDIGAESTRPGSRRLSEEEESRRLIPVLKRLRGKLSIPVSVDTYKSGVADRVLKLGAEIINDPSALTFDPQTVKIAVKHDAGLILNHMRGTPETWAKLGPLPDVMKAVLDDLQACVHRTHLAGLDRERIVIDPGLGFGKRKDETAEILARLPQLSRLDLPVLVGPSRKGFLGQATEEGKLFGTAAAVAAAILGGTHIVRVHDVKEMIPVVQVADAILSAGSSI
jgi:dihydropteroate synthase